MKRKHITLILLAITVAGLAIRNLYPQNILFGFEQGRDFFVAKDIATLHKFTLLGPKTDIEGIFHGAYYYYLLAFFYFVTSGNPFTIAIFFTLISSLTILIIYKTCVLLFKNPLWGIIGAILTTFSFNLVVYARWISNVSPAVPIFATFFYFLIKIINSRNGKYFPFAFFFGFLLLHFEILSIIPVLTTISFVLIIYRIRLRLKDFLFSVFAISFNIFPFLLFEIKHQFLLINGVKRYLSAGGTQEFNLINNLRNYFAGINTEISSTIFPLIRSYHFFWVIFISIIFILVFLKFAKNERKNATLVFFSIFGTFPLFIFLNYSSLEQFFVGASIPIIVFFIFVLQAIHTNIKATLKPIFIFLIAIVIIVNIAYTIQSLKSRNNIFYYTSQKEVVIGKKINVIKYMQSFDEKYSFDAFTTPIYRPDGWNYLNDWMNKNNQINKEKESKLFFLAIEPFTDKHWLELWINKYNKKSVLKNTFYIDGIILQERKIK